MIFFRPTPYNSGNESSNAGITSVQRTATRKAPLPGAVWSLGVTSLFMDFSSEMIHGLLPVFLVLNLGASAAVLGLVEGIAEATAQITRVFSGWLSDLLRRRKALAVAGYGLAAVTKPLFPLATSVGTVLFTRFADRVGTAPPDVTPADQRGGGLRPPSIARHHRCDSWTADSDRSHGSRPRRHPHRVCRLASGDLRYRACVWRQGAAPLRLREIAPLGHPYWFVVAAGTVFVSCSVSGKHLLFSSLASAL